jgi:uncharacterized membrane protein YdbT with pleckstrin-like domain
MSGIEGLAEAMGYVQSVLLPGERVAYHAQLHWAAYWRALVLSLFGALLLLDGDTVSAMTALVVFVLAAFVLIAPWTTEIAITNHRVILKQGLLRRGTIEIKIDKVASVIVRQSILGRILNFGTVIVRWTGGNASPLAYVDAPFALRQALRR